MCITAILSKGCKPPDNFEPHNSLKLNCTSIQGLCSNFVECESFLESDSGDILALCERNLNDPIDSGNFTVRDLALLQSVSYFFFLYLDHHLQCYAQFLILFDLT